MIKLAFIGLGFYLALSVWWFPNYYFFFRDFMLISVLGLIAFNLDRANKFKLIQIYKMRKRK